MPEAEVLDAEVKARVPSEEKQRVEDEASHRSKSGSRVSAADIVREALHEYFSRRPKSKKAA